METRLTASAGAGQGELTDLTSWQCYPPLITASTYSITWLPVYLAKYFG